MQCSKTVSIRAYSSAQTQQGELQSRELDPFKQTFETQFKNFGFSKLIC
jgi:hypothetical protein